MAQYCLKTFPYQFPRKSPFLCWLNLIKNSYSCKSEGSFLNFSASSVLITFAGFSTATTLSGISFTTTLPPLITTLFPIVIPGITCTPALFFYRFIPFIHTWKRYCFYYIVFSEKRKYFFVTFFPADLYYNWKHLDQGLAIFTIQAANTSICNELLSNCNCSEPSKTSKNRYKMLAFLKLFLKFYLADTPHRRNA